MAHESFEDEEVAALMNDAFVNVKVDREVLPDVDDFMMAACLAMNGSGGWPLNVVCAVGDGDGETTTTAATAGATTAMAVRPFFAATYVPKNAKYG
jgi:uncharacterized protein YyaL (SSP411 family)